MDSRSIFYDNWRDCLRAHYLYVLRNNDALNEASLRTVLLDTGFSEEEIAEMRQYSPEWVEPAAQVELEEAAPPELELEQAPPAPAWTPRNEEPAKPRFYQPTLF